jgi:SAM-dependent methyltransferase
MAPLYDQDLAYIQAVGFSGMASAAARHIVAMLRGRSLRAGTIGDIGCGAGVSTRCFLDAGYDVWALEPSRHLLEIARAAAPEATFLPPASVYESELPRSDAIVALGEPLNYHPPDGDAEARVFGFFSEAAAALRPSGLLVFDVIVRGEPSLTARRTSAGEDWAVLVRANEDSNAGRLRRDIRTFRRIGDGWRRGHETHHVRVFEADTLRAALLRSGFDVQTAAAYGSYRLAPRRIAFVCSLVSR